MKNPSIFNDVIGPIMRGPSSSHCAAANRIGLISRDLMNGQIESVIISYDVRSSLATTHESQGSAMGLYGGFLGFECHDERILDSEKALAESGIQVNVVIDDFGFEHPSTYQLELKNAECEHTLTAISTGGGMIEIISIDGFELRSPGDCFETLVFLSDGHPSLSEIGKFDKDWLVSELHFEDRDCIRIRTLEPIPEANIEELKSREGVTEVKTMRPVLPVLSLGSPKVPYVTAAGMAEYNSGKDLSLADLAIQYEQERSGLSKTEILERTEELVSIWRQAIKDGLAGTTYEDRILGWQSQGFQAAQNEGRLADCGALNLMITYVTALMEVKSSMGVIIAAPTVGSCAGLPGALIGLADHLDMDDKTIVDGVLASALIGVFIANTTTFSAEVAGCQAECGSASGMAAAGIVEMMGGTSTQAVSAASIALQNVLGMICDPVAVRVEVPCLGKNAMAASNALTSANMALAGYDPVIPLDEVTETMDKVGKSLPMELRCTGLGGLSITRTSKLIEKRLEENKND